jgi:alkaline phosphatase D
MIGWSLPILVRRTTARFVLVAGLALAPIPTHAQEGAPLTRIAFGSCAHQDKPQPIWDAILRYRPDLFIFAGDNVYGDLTPGAANGLREAYAKAATIEGYRKLRESVRVLETWDDHDYGRNDAGGDFPYKDEAKALFLDFWHVPADDPRRRRAGVYNAGMFGPAGMRLQVILLDLRSFRSPLRRRPEGTPGIGPYLPDPDPAKTMLGEAQWAWLAEQLREPADLRLIVSSVQVLAEGHGYERWGNLPRERERLLELIKSTHANGVILLSGDRHVGALYRLAEGVPYPLYEITSSGLNMFYPEAHEPGPLRLGAVYGRENFGTIDIDWWAGEVTLSVRALNGEPVRQVVVPLKALSGG